MTLPEQDEERGHEGQALKGLDANIQSQPETDNETQTTNYCLALVDCLTCLKPYRPTDAFHLQHSFESVLFACKGGVLLFLIVITVVYQGFYRNEAFAETLLHDYNGKILVCMASLQEAILGVLSVMFVILSRHGCEGMHCSKVFACNGHWRAFLAVFCILFMFSFAKESSGLNRFVARNDILEGKGIYYNISIGGKLNITAATLLEIETGGDPFIKAAFYVLAVVVFFFFFGLSCRMMNLAYRGWKTGIFDVPKNPGKILGSRPTIGRFAVEVVVLLGLVNFIPSLATPKILFGTHHEW